MSAPPRQQWVDVARGVGITLVVYGHILLGHFNSQPPRWVQAQTDFIYAFHMPLFFMVSGFYLWSSLGRDNFLQTRWSQLIYPYLFWSIVTVTLEIMLARFVNSPLSIREALLIPFVPLEQFWFLYALLICQMVAFIAFPRKLVLIFLAILGAMLLALAGGEWIVIRSFRFLPFVVLGIVGKGAIETIAHSSWRRQLLVSGLSWTMFALLWFSGLPAEPILFGTLGSLGTLTLAMLLSRSAVLAALGRASLAIYLMHTIFGAGTRIGLSQAGIAPSSMISVTSSVLLGIALPFIVWEWARRTRRTKIIGLGG